MVCGVHMTLQLFLDGITCVITDKVDGFPGTFEISDKKVDLDALLKNVGLIRKRKPHCIITREAFDNRLEALEDFKKGTEVLFHTDGNCFQAFYTSLPGFSQAKLEAMKIATPHFVFGCGNICTSDGLCPHIGVGNTVHRDCILILVWKASEENAEYSRVRISSDKGTYDANIVCKGEYVFSVNVLLDVTSLHVGNSFNGSKEEFEKAVHEGKAENNYKLYLPIYFWTFSFSEG